MSEIKYKLLKELPFCKIGDIGIIEDDTLRFYYENGDSFEFYYTQTIPKLLKQGWIEEYKPKTQEEIVDDIFSVIHSEVSKTILPYEHFEKYIKETLNNYEIKEK